MVSTLISVAAVLLVAYLAVGVTLYIMQPGLLYRPVREVLYTPADLDLDFEDVFFKSADGLQLNGWFVRAENAGFTVLFCHGNGGNIAHRLDSINLFNNMDLNCFIFDYRGYGRSGGRPSEEGTYLDAQAACKWLTEEKKIRPDSIIIFGRSLGASIAAHLAGGVDAAALVIESAFTSYVDMGRKFYPYLPVRMFAKFSYSTIDYIKAITCPVMIIHSRNDELVPFEFAARLYEAAPEPKEFVELFGGHNDAFLTAAETYNRAWAKWLKSLLEHRDQADAHQAS